MDLRARVQRDRARRVLTYIANDSPEAARGVLEEALGTAEALAMLSERGRVVPELEDPLIREVFIGNYRLLYEVTPAEVSILAILHGARGFAKWREEG